MTTTVAVTQAWAAVVAGPNKFLLQNQAGYTVSYRIAATDTQTGTNGMRLSPGETHPVYVPDGSSLYACVSEQGGVTKTGSVCYSVADGEV